MVGPFRADGGDFGVGCYLQVTAGEGVVVIWKNLEKSGALCSWRVGVGSENGKRRQEVKTTNDTKDTNERRLRAADERG
jgi:hypothetical protein